MREAKLLTLVASGLAHGDCIDDADCLTPVTTHGRRMKPGGLSKSAATIRVTSRRRITSGAGDPAHSDHDGSRSVVPPRGHHRWAPESPCRAPSQRGFPPLPVPRPTSPSGDSQVNPILNRHASRPAPAIGSIIALRLTDLFSQWSVLVRFCRNGKELGFSIGIPYGGHDCFPVIFLS